MCWELSSYFFGIFTIGERIEHGLKSGKIVQSPFAATNAKKLVFNSNRKKEGEVQTAFAVSY